MVEWRRNGGGGGENEAGGVDGDRRGGGRGGRRWAAEEMDRFSWPLLRPIDFKLWTSNFKRSKSDY